MTDTTTTKPECDPQFNLEHFLNGLTLQPMILGERAPRMPPPKGRSTMIPLQMRPGGYRNLEEIKAFECLDDEVTSFFSNFKDPIGNGEAFTTMKLSSQVPAKDVESMFLGNPYEVHAPSSALFVIERGPIKNVQQLVHTINPELRDHAFYTPARTAILNAQKVDPVYFCTFDASGAMSAVKCVVIALPPWNFSPQDFEDFTTMQAFSDGSTSRDGLSNDPPWRNADRMWAYLHDLCFIHECHHFVLTSYQQWAFGAFSTYYTTGFVTPTTPWDAKPKSVLELFTYWTLDACRTENTIMMEQVPREKHLDCVAVEQAQRLYRARLANGAHLIGPGPIPIPITPPPLKRARKDPVEDRMGWEPLDQHWDAFPLSPSELIPRRSNVRGADSENGGDPLSLAKPPSRWNRYTKKREPVGKENPPQRSEEATRTGKTKMATHAQFGYPIPCYSLDVDRDNNCFRPEPIGLVSFPIPKP